MAYPSVAPHRRVADDVSAVEVDAKSDDARLLGAQVRVSRQK
jgi:hypothetical protein